MKTCKTVLLVGSSGFLGRCLVERLASQTHVVTTHYQHQTFTNSCQYNFFQDDIRPLLEREHVGVVIFAALIEREESADVRRAMTRFAQQCQDVRMIYLSSDGIFGGEDGNYTEESLPRPRTRYGNNLLTCETLIQHYCRNACIIRPSYLYGFSQGTLDARLTRIRHDLLRGERVEMFADMYKSPLGVEQVADAVISLAQSEYSGILHVAGERLSTYEFARQAMEALGVEITHLTSVAMPTDPSWIRDTSLDSMRWQDLTGTRPLTIHETLSFVTGRVAFAPSSVR